MWMSNAGDDFDVIICGAGPAGTTCALALADSALRVAVVEKHTFPRDKVCGDAVASYVPNVLATIDPELKYAVASFEKKVVVDTCRVVAPNEKAIDISYEKSGFIAQRIHWDNFLFELASTKPNIAFFQGEAIRDITRTNDGVTVVTGNRRFNSRLAIGCDGAHSVISKKFGGITMDRAHHAGAVRAYFRNVKETPDRTFELHFLKGYLPGYFWIFPLGENSYNVGLGLLSSKVSQRKISMREAMKEIITSVPSIARRFANAEVIGDIEGFGLPLGSRKLPISGDNFMLCGDAASLIDPLSGEGIGQAMVSGRYAGWHAKKCFQAGDFSAAFMKTYDDQVYAKFWRRHRKNYLLQQVISDREWLFNLVFNVGAKHTGIRNFLVKSFA
jgi:menaquinone-9 beta-reductase